MALDPRQIYEQLKKGKVESLYYLYGPERFIIDELIEVLRKAILGKGIADFNHNILYANDCSPDEIVDAVNTLPMMAERRLVEVRGVDDFSVKELNCLLPITESPSETSVVVYIGESVDRRSKFIKALISSRGVIIECRHPYDDQIPAWVQYMSKKIKKRLDDKAIPYLLSTVGNKLSEIYNELQKGSAFVGDKETIELSDLQTIASPLRELTVFDFTKAVAKKEGKRAVQLLNSLLAFGEPEPVILAMIVRQWRLLLRGTLLLRKGTPPQLVGDSLKIHKFFQRDFFDQCKLHKPSSLRSQFNLLHDADMRIKRSGEDKRVVLEELTLRLCNSNSR